MPKATHKQINGTKSKEVILIECGTICALAEFWWSYRTMRLERREYNYLYELSSICQKSFFDKKQIHGARDLNTIIRLQFNENENINKARDIMRPVWLFPLYFAVIIVMGLNAVHLWLSRWKGSASRNVDCKKCVRNIDEILSELVCWVKETKKGSGSVHLRWSACSNLKWSNSTSHFFTDSVI